MDSGAQHLSRSPKWGIKSGGKDISVIYEPIFINEVSMDSGAQHLSHTPKWGIKSGVKISQLFMNRFS